MAEGADMVMVKPALHLPRRRWPRCARPVDVPVAAYHVSGEYAMVKAAAERGWIDGPAVALEQITAVKRAGADFVLTYFAGRAGRGPRWLTGPARRPAFRRPVRPGRSG